MAGKVSSYIQYWDELAWLPWTGIRPRRPLVLISLEACFALKQNINQPTLLGAERARLQM